ncbi:MFS transporter [Pelagibius sp.]|uniref:MFS transporter n=1 Tax=Pelagibius sp. TaxID=1931238 RepID=UPI002602FCE4|nr:MFS transporter [Pelagibius sp.]
MPRRTVFSLALSQLICWGVSFYLIGVFGSRIGAEMGWSATLVHSGLSVALVVMGLISLPIGWLIDRFGGGPVMAAGSLFSAAGCLGLAMVDGLAGYYAAWVCLGFAMRATLYEAAFAALARIGGALARRPIAQVTLLGGLSSSVFWPLGYALAEAFGWRGALVCYAALALATLPLHLSLPSTRHVASSIGKGNRGVVPPARPAVRARSLALLYVLVMTLTTALSAAMAAHMIGLLSELGLGAAVAVAVSALRGLGQTLGRLLEVLFGSRIDPIDLNLAATLLLPVCFIVGLGAAISLPAAASFVLVYGAANGVITITGGTMPLRLFDSAAYGASVGALRSPAFLAAAVAPFAFAAVLERWGAEAVLAVSTVLAIVAVAASVALRVSARRVAPLASRADAASEQRS